MAVYSKRVHRVAVGLFFFLLGLSFASWASRIPTIQQSLHLTDAALGAVLFTIPAGSILSLPLSGWLVAKVGSKKIAIIALLFYSLALIGIGASTSLFSLVACLFIYGMAGNTSNISINTQAAGVEELYGQSIMASFHGLWSLAGFTGATIGTVMIRYNIVPLYHFTIVATLIILCIIINAQYALPKDANVRKVQPVFIKPDKTLLHLGLIAFCSMICEVAMFDWSGVYFKKVVLVEEGLIGTGYTAFMCTMATGRFIADWFTSKFGFKATLQVSGVLTTTGLLIAVAFPHFGMAITGFLLVDFGVSSIVPLIYSAAGKSKVLSAGVALAAVSSIGFIGFLIGPPMIGLVAGLTSLRVSFSIIAIMGLCITLIATLSDF